ncbi:MAG: FecR family protein [Proteobacteria bacterium]|jgi:hypothetical protein|nr:FecR family protein [Pseudomonadota bacterium]
MTDDTGKLERVGARIAEALGDGPPEERKAVQRRAFLAAASGTNATRRGERAWVLPGLVAAAAVALLAIVAAALLSRGAAPLQFWVGEQQVAGTEGSWVQSDRGEAVPIRFRNGSRLDLGGATAVRIASANTEQVTVEMSRGELSADIRRNGETAWEVNAGPYQIRVLGTAFTVDWSGETSRLAVSVTRGVVHVRGGHLSEYGIRLAAGKRLVAGDPSGRVAVEAMDDGARAGGEAAIADATPAKALPAGEADESIEGGAGPSERAPKARPPAREKKAPPAESWKSHYAKRDYPAAIAAAESEGIDALLGRLDIEDLWDLSNASRFAHRSDIARRCLLAVRARFSWTPRAATAAFLLGRGELDEGGSPEVARGWFETYLREANDGPLAEESLGRLMEACDKSGAQEDARRYAERYLSRYQDGLFAVLAKSILSR